MDRFTALNVFRQVVDLVEVRPLHCCGQYPCFGSVRFLASITSDSQNCCRIKRSGARDHALNLGVGTDRNGPDSLAGKGVRGRFFEVLSVPLAGGLD